MRYLLVMVVICIVFYVFLGPSYEQTSIQENNTIKIGEMMSYTSAPRFAGPYRDGWKLAVSQANQAGGINGRLVEVISRDDMADAGTAVRIAQEMIDREGVVMLVGAGLNHIGLAVGDVANHRKTPFLKNWSGACDIIQNPSNKYWFNNAECTGYYGYILAKVAAEKPYKRWAMIAPNYEYGRDITKSFKRALKALRPDVEFVSERYPTLNKIAAQEEIRAIIKEKPEAIFNQLFGSDIVQYLRVSQQLGVDEDYFHIGNYLGMPTTMRELGNAYPNGWYTHGMPADLSNYPRANEFAQIFQTAYGYPPDMPAFEGYRMMRFALVALEKAKSFNADDIVAAMQNLEVNTPTGRHRLRAEDKQIHAGYWGGYTKRENGVNSFVSDEWTDITDISKEYQP